MTPLFRSVLPRQRDIVVLLAAYREFQEQERNVTSVVIYHKGNWVSSHCSDNLVSLCSGEPGVIYCLDWRGMVRRLDSAVEQSNVERARPMEASTGYLWTIVRLYDGSVVCAGTFGEVYWRSPSGWTPLGNVRDDCKLEKPPTFWALAGRSISELYGAGDRGRIFKFDGRKWRELDSPTNYTLRSMICDEDGTLTCCGQSKTIIRGIDDSWTVLSFEDGGEDLWSVVSMDGVIYSAGWRGIYKEGQNGFEDISPDLEGFGTKSLGVAESQLWSVGERFIAYMEDGKWTQVRPPETLGMDIPGAV